MYFEPFENPIDKQTYYKYNNKYFETNRKDQEWSDCPDLFSKECDEEVKPYLDKLLGKPVEDDN